jgi:hypothetical protein
MTRLWMKVTSSENSLLNIFTALLAGIGLMVSCFSISEFSTILIIILVFSGVLIILTIVIECRKIFKQYVFRKDDREAIAKFMDNFIVCNGEIVIFSNSLSWIDLFRNRKKLEEKAAEKELTIIMPHKNHSADELKRRGAKIYYYDGEIAPKSRFTIVNYDGIDSSIAIGIQTDGLHRIDVYKTSDPVTQLAHDFIELVKLHIKAEI